MATKEELHPCGATVTVDANDHDWSLEPDWQERTCILPDDEHSAHIDSTGDAWFGWWQR